MEKRKRQKKKNHLGYYLTLDIYDCAPKTVGDLETGYLFLDELPKLLGIKKLSPPFIVYTDEKKYPDKAGLSGWIPFIDQKTKMFSGASLHTLTPTNFISIDIFSSREIDREKVKELTRKAFGPKKIEEEYLVRGKSRS
jgi:S-adenosylmethionine decarboxylase